MKNQKKNITKTVVSVALTGVFLMSAAFVSAHVTVKPNQVGSAAFQTFTTGVPNEKDVPTVALRLVIPSGLQYVTPNVKPGWTIEVKKSGEGEALVVTEIIWTGGSIPAGQRDEFLFSAQVPAEETTLQWKAYQTYSDGEVVAWDQAPSQDHDDHDVKPYSETKIVNDLALAEGSHSETEKPASTDASLPTALSVVALALSGGALFLSSRKKK